MTRTVVEPGKSTLLAGLIAIGDISNPELLEHFYVKSIEVDTDDLSWLIVLESAARSGWATCASKTLKTEFENTLRRIGQEIRNKVDDLEQVRWSIPPGLDRFFKAPAPTADAAPASRRAKDPFSRGASLQREDAAPLSSFTGGEKRGVTVWGEIVDLIWRRNTAGKFDGTLVITDKTSSVRIRIPSIASKLDELQVGVFILAKGRATLDRFDSEPVLVVSAPDIAVVPPEFRKDTASRKRVELHLHTKMSAMDSVLDLEKAVKRAKDWGHSAIAITDHGVVQAFPAAFALGKELGIKIIYGLEAYMVDEGKEKAPAYHVVLLSKTQQGLRNLYELVTESHLKHFYRTPRIPRQLLAARREGLLVGSACEAGELFQAVLANKPREELLEIVAFYDYLEIQPLDNNEFLIDAGLVADRAALAGLNKTIYALSKTVSKPCVMTSDAHYLDPEDEVYRSILLRGKGMNDGEKSGSIYFRTTREMILEASGYLGQDAAEEVVVDNPRAIASSVEELRPVPEGSYFPVLENADGILKNLAKEGAARMYGPALPEEVRARLDKELDAITKNDFSSLYLIAIRMVEESIARGFKVGSRGSVGSSFVATCTGITEVNPLPPHYVCLGCFSVDFDHGQDCASGFDLLPQKCKECGQELVRDGQDIPFESFMGFHGEKVPDIDLNFSGEVQAEIVKYASVLLGEGNVFRAGTIGTIARKTAYGFVKHYQEDLGLSLRRAEETRLTQGIEGVKRTTGQHPGGVMVIPRGHDVLDFTPLQYPADDRQSGSITTHFDYDSLAGRLVKVDILGHDDPTTLKMLHELTGVDPFAVPMDDSATMRLFSGEDPGDAAGLPEFGTRFVRGMLSETKPKCFADLVRISGLSHGTDVWANNARDLIRAGSASLSEVIASREDICQTLTRLGMDPAEAFGIAEYVRKGRTLPESSIFSMNRHSIPDWYIASCRKISYLFPKAHAAAYVTSAFRIAYYKAHHPLAFAAAYFSSHGSSLSTELIALGEEGWREWMAKVEASAKPSAKDQDVYSVLEVALEMSKRGVRFGKPSLYRSDAKKYIPEDGNLMPPLTAIPGVGASAAQAILNARAEDSFTSIEDFRRRTKLGKKVTETLTKEGMFQGLPEQEQLSLF